MSVAQRRRISKLILGRFARTVVSRAGGLTGHIVEERATHSGRHIWNMVEHAIPYEEPKE